MMPATDCTFSYKLLTELAITGVSVNHTISTLASEMHYRARTEDRSAFNVMSCIANKRDNNILSALVMRSVGIQNTAVSQTKRIIYIQETSHNSGRH